MPNRTAASVTKAHSICHRETTVTAPVLYSTRLWFWYPLLEQFTQHIRALTTGELHGC